MADAASLALACRKRPQLAHRLVQYKAISPFAFSSSLAEEALLKNLAAAKAIVQSAPRATARTLVPADELLPLLLHPAVDVRSRAAKLIAILLGVPDAARARLSERWADSKARQSSQQVGLSLNASEGNDDDEQEGSDHTVCEQLDDTVALSADTLGDELASCTKAAGSGAASSSAVASASLSSPPTFVSIPHAEDALTGLALALASQRPLLLSGAAGSGKSALVGELARRLGQRDSLVVVHMDEQIDSKVLLGTYVCTEGAGEFAWQPGVVSQAVAHGRWLVLEDVDRAPLEVMAALAPLLEGGSLYLPGRATSLTPPPTFRLFATLTVHTARASAASAAVARSVYRPANWQHVHVPPPTAADLRKIVATRFPSLAAAAKPMVHTLFSLVRAASQSAAAEMVEASLEAAPVDGANEVVNKTEQQQEQQQKQQQKEEEEQAAVAKAADDGDGNVTLADVGGDDEADETDETGLEGARSAIGGGRALSSRDLLRWCARVSGAIAAIGLAALPPTNSPHFTGALRELVLVEALDIFVGALRKDVQRKAVAQRLARLWEVPPDRLRYIVLMHKPQLQSTPQTLRVGRVALPVAVASKVNDGTDGTGGLAVSGGAFAHTRQTLTLMESVAACVRMEESVLLVGETGTGKTTAVQHLARSIGKELLVHNLSEQSDSSELIGGYRPVQMRHIFAPLASRFEAAFCSTFSRARNAALLDKLAVRLAKGEWKKLIQIMNGALRTVGAKQAQAQAAEASQAQAEGRGGGGGANGGGVDGAGSALASSSSKRQRTAGAASPSAAAPGAVTDGALPPALAAEWADLAAEIARAQRQIEHPSEEGVAFAFVEGSLVRALREGHWLLLDEMNLASPETLERVAAVLEDGGSVALTERGEADAVRRHPDFRIFGAMNPPTDFGKKELPPGIRARFTELYVPPLTSAEDLQLVVLGILKPVLPHPPVASIVALYHAAMAEAEKTLLDGANQRPQYSLRTLCRALAYVASAIGSYGLERALWDGFHMTFVTQLQQRHQPLCESLMLTHLLPKRAGALAKPPPMSAPSMPSDGKRWVQFGGFWIQADPRGEPHDDARYIVTATVEARLQTVARMVAARRFPVLLQGPTSAGKTSMVERLARATGHRLVRINNHEHTDVQEYIGSFQPGSSGRLEFCDGALTQAVRHGYWIVLDELNLAPSEVRHLRATRQPPTPCLCTRTRQRAAKSPPTRRHRRPTL